MSKATEDTITPSCGNVFADLELPNADELLKLSDECLDKYPSKEAMEKFLIGAKKIRNETS